MDTNDLDSIIKNGLLCTNEKNEKGIKHKNIANMTIQERRAGMDVPVGPGGKVHDYVPFYEDEVPEEIKEDISVIISGEPLG